LKTTPLLNHTRPLLELAHKGSKKEKQQTAIKPPSSFFNKF